MLTPTPPGTFTNLEASIVPIDCAVGTFQPLFGQISCNPTTPGHFVDVTGSPVQFHVMKDSSNHL